MRETGTWIDPWDWSAFRDVRRQLRIASGCMMTAIAGFIPAAWIILVPDDPTLRPDLSVTAAWIGLGICVVLALSGNTIARRARAHFDQAVYEITRRTRDTAAAQGFPLEIDIGETFPPILVSRQHHLIGIVAPEPLILRMEQLESVEAIDEKNREPGTPHHPYLVLRLSLAAPKTVHVVPGRGLARPNLQQIEVLRERVKEFLDPRGEWDHKATKAVDINAFIESMRKT